MPNLNYICLLIITIFLSGIISGCAPTKTITNFTIPGTGYPKYSYAKPVYHKMKKGQTLWRVAQNYGVDLDELARVNNIKDYASVKSGQLIFIPKASKEIDVNNSYASKIQINREDRFIAPVNGRIKLHYGEKKGLIVNKGIDISAPCGANVVSAKSGVVSYIDSNMRGLGKVIFIDHQDGYISIYAHLSDILISQGEIVRQGQKIGLVGSSGLTDEPALHFEIRKDAKPIDPQELLPIY